ncbi:MAG: hypothetical protein DRQ55_09840 [Planctomycetota bacterium]|nr:MAG: hypothetical protein DRQ55_09840 [Planctomycetota bacterium]
MTDLFSQRPAPRVCFDIELSNVIELAPGEDLDKYGPFDISCAAASTDGEQVRHWTTPGSDGRPALQLDQATAADMLGWLRQQQLDGARLFAWNGLSFDLRWIGSVAGDAKLAGEVALDLYDPMFQFFVQRGFPVGLAAVAQALGVEEQKLMSGADAPVQWQAGNHQLVLDYVAGDCRITDQVVRGIEQAGCIRWRTRKGTVSSEPVPELRRVRDLLTAPEPDVSWMDSPIPRSKFTAWLPAELLS